MPQVLSDLRHFNFLTTAIIPLKSSKILDIKTTVLYYSPVGDGFSKTYSFDADFGDSNIFCPTLNKTSTVILFSVKHSNRCSLVLCD